MVNSQFDESNLFQIRLSIPSHVAMATVACHSEAMPESPARMMAMYLIRSLSQM
jgi:hypothetical protein